MGTGNEVKINLSAVDTATPAIQQAQQIIEQYNRTLQSAGGIVDQYGRSVNSSVQQVQTFNNVAATQAERVGKVEREFDKLTSASEFLASGITSVRRAFEAMVWGTIIGAISSVVSEFIDWALNSSKVETSLKDLTTTVETQAQNWGLLIAPIKNITAATINLYNAELLRAQLMATEGIPQAKIEKAALEEKNKKLAESVEMWLEVINNEKMAGSLRAIAEQQFRKLTKEMVDNKVKAAELGVELEKYNQILGLTLQSQDNVEKSSKAFATGEAFAAQEILRQAQKAWKDKGDIQEQKGRDILAEAQRQWHDHVTVEEQKGRDIVAVAQREWKDRASIQEQMGRDIVAAEIKTQTDLARVQEQMGRDIVLAQQMSDGGRAAKLLSDDNNKLIKSYEDLIIKHRALMGELGKSNQVAAITEEVGRRTEEVYSSIGNALQQWILGEKSLGTALREALAQRLAAWAVEDTISALRATALGFYQLAQGNVAAAALSFTAATQFAETALLEGAAAAVAARAGSGGAGTSSTSDSTTETNATDSSSDTSSSSSDTPQPITNNIYIYGNLVDMDELSRSLMKNSIYLEADKI